MRIEPAFARAADFVVGERFAEWTRTAQRAGLQLTKTGIAAWKRLDDTEDVLADEKAFLKDTGRKVTEDFVSRLLQARRV
jgi:hypothetical protein